MKNKITISFLVMLTGNSLWGMEAQTTLNPVEEVLYSPDLRLKLVKHLFAINEPVFCGTTDLRALALIDKRSLEVLKEEGITHSFIDLLNQFSKDLQDYQSSILYLYAVRSLLSKDVLKPLWPYLVVKLLQEHGEETKWNILKNLKTMRNDGFIDETFASVCWNYEHKLPMLPKIERSLLNYAIGLNAPLDSIKLLIELGAPLRSTNPHAKLASPLLLAVQNFISRKDRDQQSLPSDFKELLNLLIESGASMEEEFPCIKDNTVTQQSALSTAIMNQEKELVEYFLDQGKNISFIDYFLIAAAQIVYCTDPVNDGILKMLLERCQDKQPLLFVLIAAIGGCDTIVTEQLRDKGEEYLHAKNNKIIHILSLLIKEGVAINYISEGMTALDLARSCRFDETIIEFLTAQGAREGCVKLSTEESAEKALFLRKFWNLIIRASANQEPSLEELRTLLREAPEVLSTLTESDLAGTPFSDIKVLCKDVVGTLSGTTLLRDPLSDETFNFFSFVAKDQQDLFSFFAIPSYGPITSIFHFLVGIIHTGKPIMSSQEFDRVTQKETISPLLLKLAKKGFKDDKESNGKTAVERAYELGLDNLALLISETQILYGNPTFKPLTGD